MVELPVLHGSLLVSKLFWANVRGKEEASGLLILWELEPRGDMVSRRGFLEGISALSVSGLVPALKPVVKAEPTTPLPPQPNHKPTDGSALECGNSLIRIRVSGSPSILWSLENRKSGEVYRFEPPTFPVSGKPVQAALEGIRVAGVPQVLRNGVTEFSFEGTLSTNASLKLLIVFQVAPDNAFVRFRYSLQGLDQKAFSLDPHSGPLIYLSTSFAKLSRVKEVQISNWNALLHSNTLGVLDVPDRLFQNKLGIAGPIIVGTADDKETLLLAYEHGSQMPDTFLRFDLQADRGVKLAAVKGNYVPGHALQRFDTIWMEASVSGDGIEGTARQFRKFVREAMDSKGTSRRPFLFYNTWNFQERDKWWYSKEYLSSYNNEKMLAEIDVAHRLGIDIFVIVTGWYTKTGDWQEDHTRLQGGLKTVKARLDQYGMTLGLWFNPTMAAVSSQALATHRSDISAWQGKVAEPGDVWGSEESYPMCLVSDYSDFYADTVIRVARETGARYFVWDAVAQYGCDSPNHWHGTVTNTQEERSDSYAFQLPIQMVRIVEKVRSVYPEIILDFDITEDGRAVGLGFLSAGRFFLANNGPYLADYDLPHKSGAQNDNIFFFPGPARTWICRKPLNYDEWIPSNLFLTHYFPDDPLSSQLVNMATLVLGQNGIWGSLSQVSEPGVAWMAQILSRYKQISQDVMDSDPLVTGAVSGSYEVHEKIHDASGRGVAVLFSTTKGKIAYVTEHNPSRQIWATDGTHVSFDEQGRAVIESDMESGAAIVLFGVK